MKRTYTYVRSFPWDVCHGPMSKKSLPGIFWMRRRISRQCQAPSSPQTILKLCRCLHEPTQRKTCGDSELLTYVASSTSITDSRHCYFTLSTSLSLSFLFADVDFKIISETTTVARLPLSVLNFKRVFLKTNFSKSVNTILQILLDRFFSNLEHTFLV